MEKKQLILELDTMSLLQINGSKEATREPIFSFTSAPQNGKIKAVTPLTYCRETVCEYIRQEVRCIRHSGINLKKLHMVIHRRTSDSKVFRGQISAGLAMLNVLEKNYGWPLTRAYPVKCGLSTLKNKFYYITASKRWIKAPAMLSLFTLLFRIAENNKKYKFGNKIRSMKSLFAVLDDLYSKSNEEEILYYGEHGDNWQKVLSNYGKLFGSRTIEDLYSPKEGGYFFTEGINELCDLTSSDTTLNEEFSNIVHKGAK